MCKSIICFHIVLIINYLLGNRVFPTVAKLYKDKTKDDNGNGKLLVCAENPSPSGEGGERAVGGIWHTKLFADSR